MTKRILILTVAVISAAALAGTALAGKPAILLPGGTYLNQSPTTGLSCLGGTDTAPGATTFVVSVPSSQSGQGVTFQLDYTYDPDDPALPSYSGAAAVRAQIPLAGVAAVPVAISVTSDDGTKATVVNATVISIDSTGTLYFDATSLTAWACGGAPTATGGATGGGCASYGPLLAAVSGIKGDAPKKVVESQRECLKGHLKEARHKLDEFVKHIAKAPALADATVAGLIDQALAIRSGLG